MFLPLGRKINVRMVVTKLLLKLIDLLGQSSENKRGLARLTLGWFVNKFAPKVIQINVGPMYKRK